MQELMQMQYVCANYFEGQLTIILSKCCIIVKVDVEQCPLPIVTFVLDRKYKYGRRFVRYQLFTKVSWY